jgi:hypothetical protein
MKRFLIEVSHSAEELECAQAVQYFLRTGSHFMTRTDWGCKDGVHKGWVVVEVDSKEEARRLVPPAFHSQIKIVGLNKFTIEEIDEYLRLYPGKK